MGETVEGQGGMVVAPHRAAAEAGAAVLREGGNALEAVIAAAATIAVVYPHMNGIGGDVFLLVAEPGREPRGVDACGAAGSFATIKRYHAKGYDAVPARGPDAALTVAGAVSGWALAAEIAEALGGRIPRRELLADAVRRAKEGIVVSRSQARMTEEHLDELAPVPGFAGQFLVDGKPPEAGSRMVEERLADTLEQIAHTGYDDFYRGDIGATIAADLEEVGSPVTRADLAKQEAELVKPLSVRLSDATIFNMPPPTQGLASLIILGLFERLGREPRRQLRAPPRADRGGEARLHRPRPRGDRSRLRQRSLRIPERRLARPRGRFRSTASGRRAFGGGGEKGDTIWLGAIDEKGRAVSFIQSIFWEFGSGVVLPRTGILWQNRGMSFSLDKDAVNPLMPGRKPFHTLNPPLARFNDGRVMTYGSMGGDGQPQFQAQIFTRIARFGMAPGDAIAAPRWLLGKTWGRDIAGLAVEGRFDTDVATALGRAGHEVRPLDEDYADSMGHAGAILRLPNGRVLGASDPRSDGAAVAG